MPEQTSSPRAEDTTPRPSDRRSWSARLRKLAWLPIPILLLVMIVSWAMDVRLAYDLPILHNALNFLTRTLACLLIVLLAGRSFLVRGAPGLLLLGCGVAIWGASGYIGTALVTHRDANLGVAISNLGIWQAALCHLTGVILSVRSERTCRSAGLWLGAGYALALGVVGLITLAVFRGWLPVFFVEGQGGTQVRHIVLSSALVMFVFTAVLLREGNRPVMSPFAWWYTLTLLLIAAGVFGMLLQASRNSVLNWACRTTQYLSGIYMFIAALASVREAGVRGISLGERLRESEERYRSLFSGMTEGFAIHEIICDAQGVPCDYRFVDINPAFERLTGLRREDVVGKAKTEVLGLANDDAHWIKIYGKVALTGEPVQFENYSSALKRHYEVYAYRPAPHQFAVIFMDITKRKRTEEALRESEERHRLLAETMLQGVVHQDADGQIIAMNPAAERILGKTREEFLGSSSVREEHDTLREDGSLFPGLEHPAMVALRTGQPVRGVVMGVYNPQAGDYRWISIDAVPVCRPGSARPAEVYTVFEDITERKQAEEALRESERRYSALFANKINGMAHCRTITDEHGRPVDYVILQINEAYERIIGIKKTDIEGRRVTEVFPEIKNYALDYIGMYGKIALEGSEIQFEEFFEATGQCLSIYAYSPVRGEFIAIFSDVTDRKRAEDALKLTQASVDGAAEMVAWFTSDGKVYYVNDATCRTLGYSREELLNMTALDFSPGFTQEQYEEHWREVRQRKSFTLQPLHRRKDGSTYTAEVLVNYVVFGGREFLFAYGRDITERKQAEEALRRSEARWTAAIENFKEGAIIATEAEQVIYWNPAARVLHGFTSDQEGIGPLKETPNTFQLWTPDGSRLLELDEWPMRRIKRGETVQHLELRLRRPDQGWEKIVSYSGAMVETAGGERLIFLSVYDLTDQRRAEEALRESEERFRLMGDTIPYGAWMADAEGRNIYISPLFLELVGMTFEEVKEFGWTGKMPPDDVEPIMQRWMECVRTERDWEGELRFPSPDGQWHTILSRGKPVRDAGGHLKAWVGINVDITERKQAEAALRESESFYRQTLESIPGMVFTTRPDGYCDYQSQQWVEYTGVPMAEHLGDGWNKLLHPDDRPRSYAAWKAAVEGRAPYDLEYRVRRHDGVYEWFKVIGRPIQDAEGRIVRWFGVAANIQELKQTEEALREADRRKEVLLKEIHHRVKNNMQVISSLVSLQADGMQDPAVREIFQDMTDRVRSMALVHEKLYQSDDLARVDFAEYTRSLLNYLWRAHGTAASGVQLVLDLQPVPLSVDAAVPCGLILNELVGNALKHAFRGRTEGEVTVTLRGGAEIPVRLSVRDNGVGMPADLELRQARSLGLRLVQILSDQLDATVEIRINNGTEFEVVFGVSEKQP